MAKAKRERADRLLVARDLAESRARAQALILAGVVFSGETRIDKAGQNLAEDAPLEVRGRDHPWVSRGGLKLLQGLDHFAIDPTGLTCLDVGASTGGFTDVLLNRGAVKVYAVDVGHGQLAWKLRNDSRVVVLERTNARHLTRAEVPEPVELIVCDASARRAGRASDRARQAPVRGRQGSGRQGRRGPRSRTPRPGLRAHRGLARRA